MEPKKKSGLALIMASKPEEDEPMDEDMGETPEQESSEYQLTDNSGMPTIKVPPSFHPPEDKQMGQEFTGTYRGYMTEDGMLCISALNEIPMDGSKPKEGQDMESEADSAEKASASPSNAQDEGGMESTPEIKESKKLKGLLRG